MLEGDADWDIRFKSQMQTFAQVSKMLVKPLPGDTDLFLDPIYSATQPVDTYQVFSLNNGIFKERTNFPYGDLIR
jgi:hypothetical protein